MNDTIFTALRFANKEINGKNKIEARRKLNEAVVLLEKGYPINTPIEPLINQFKSVENIPDRKIK